MKNVGQRLHFQLNKPAMSKKKKHGSTVFLILSGCIMFGIIMGVLIALAWDFPQIRMLEEYKPPAITRIYSADYVLLGELFVERRDPVPLNAIPIYIKKALIVTEDRNFYKHNGVDLKGILRAIINDILAGKFVEGASTITQQIAKNLFLTHKKTLLRKIKEAFIAFQLERRYTKDEILHLYLNQVYFGSGAYGVESAAKIFFGKSVNNLSLAECALIAGMPKSPSRYSPLINMKLAVKRRNIILKQMLITGIISETEFRSAVNEPVILGNKENQAVKAPYFVEYIKRSLENILGASLLYKGGLNIYTTLSFKLQKAADQAIADGLSALEKRMKKNGIMNPQPQAALISIDVQTGGILAMTGGRDYHTSSFNRATMALRQPGSAFKPILYALAIEKDFPQNKMILDAPAVFKGVSNGKDWRPENFSKKYKGEITLRKALALSENIPAVRLIEMLGPSSVADFGYRLGIESSLSPNLSLALGTSEVTLINLTSVYAVFPNRGEKIKPFGVIEILDHKGRIVWRAKPKKAMAMSRSGAAIMTNMLEGVIEEGTGKKALVLKHPVAGKTGTTNGFKDALFIGFSPSVATGVWVGQDDFTTLGERETGAKSALPIWIDFMHKALADRPYQYFDIPDDVVQVLIDPVSGLSAGEDSVDAVTAMFKKGTEPIHIFK